MATSACLPIAADRAGPCVRTIFFEGLDLTGVTLAMELRLNPETPGPASIALGMGATANAEGLRLVGVTTVDGLPTSQVVLRINETTMKDAAKVPYSGELGASSSLFYDLIGTFGQDKRRLAYGTLTALPTVYGMDAAPDNRPASYGGSATSSAATWSSARITFSNDVVTVRIDGADLMGAQVAKATDAATSAAGDAHRSQQAADLATQKVADFATMVAQDTARPPVATVRTSDERVVARLGSNMQGGRGRIGRVHAKDLTVGQIGGRPASSVVAFFGNGGIQRNDIVYLANIPYGQSLSLGANSSINGVTGVITKAQYYGNLMFKGGIRAVDGADFSAFVPHIEQIGQSGGAGETICGGFDAMLAQLFNAYGLTPLQQKMQTISYAPGLGESPIDSFLEGTGRFNLLIQGVQAAVDLSGGKKVVVGSIKWMQGETRGSNTDAQTITKLGQLAEALDRRIRAITGQTEPVRLRTYQFPLGDASNIFPTAARTYPLIQIVGPIYDLKPGGAVNGSAQVDVVHLSAEGYFLYGAKCAIVDFCEIYLKRPWRPLQIARDARGRVRCRRVNADTLIVRYDVPFDGELFLDQLNTARTAGGSVKQNGFFVTDANGNDLPLREATVLSRNEIILIGTGIAATGNSLNVGSPLLTRFGVRGRTSEPGYPVYTCLRDRMGDVITVDDLGSRRLHNWAVGEGWTMTAEELGL